MRETSDHDAAKQVITCGETGDHDAAKQVITIARDAQAAGARDEAHARLENARLDKETGRQQAWLELVPVQICQLSDIATEIENRGDVFTLKRPRISGKHVPRCEKV
jgi:hypothetical protein